LHELTPAQHARKSIACCEKEMIRKNAREAQPRDTGIAVSSDDRGSQQNAARRCRKMQLSASNTFRCKHVFSRPPLDRGDIRRRAATTQTGAVMTAAARMFRCWIAAIAGVFIRCGVRSALAMRVLRLVRQVLRSRGSRHGNAEAIYNQEHCQKQFEGDLRHAS
jgi:hypothetical protein